MRSLTFDTIVLGHARQSVTFLTVHGQDVLKSTRAQLERELLMDDVQRIEDMPSYSLLS